MKRVLGVILILATTLNAYGQNIKKANKKFDRGEYQTAINMYKKMADKTKTKAEANFKIAESYRLSNRILLAVPYYEAAIKNRYPAEEAHFYLAFALKANRKYKAAEAQLKGYLKLAKNEELINRANQELDNLAELVLISEDRSYYKVRNLVAINSPGAEYSPVYNDGELYFTSNRDGGKIFKTTGTSFTDLYKVKTKGARVDTTTIEKLPDVINSPISNEGTVAFTPDGKTMVFAKGNTGKKKGTADVNLYISRFRNQTWSEPRMLPISKAEAWDSSPAFSRDGRTLYFSSNREAPNAQGGTDLYSARMDRRGRFSKVKNLGPDINTQGNEMFPFISSDGHLYFASDGHPGFGGLDLFVAKRRGGKVTVENLAQPVNSTHDDFGIYLFKADRGFFTSNRPEGRGDDDIWTFVNEDPNLKTVNYFLEGVTMTHVDDEKTEVLDNVRVKLVDFSDNVLDEVVTGNDGKFNFRVYENERYVLMAEKEGAGADEYYVTRLDYNTIGKSVPQEELTQLVTNITFDTLMFLDKIIIDKAIVLENIYYDFAKWNIRADAAIELDKLVDILYDNPEISIELSSHTDSVDTESYNQRLSQRRAESAVNYIIAAGIDKNRITARGYGESRPVARNTNPDGTDNPEGRQKNRRTEFKVTKIDRSKLTPKEQDPDAFDEDKYFDDDDTGDTGDTGQE
jgi:outer membrane protein OmpA-like peptidoglycan-associated protein